MEVGKSYLENNFKMKKFLMHSNFHFYVFTLCQLGVLMLTVVDLSFLFHLFRVATVEKLASGRVLNGSSPYHF